MLPQRKHKERVIIISGNTVTQKKKCILEGNDVIIEKGKRGKQIGWKVPVKSTDYKYYRNIFGMLKRKLEIKVDATQFIPFGSESVDVISCTRKDIERYADANVINKAGISTQKIEVPFILYLIIGAVLIMQILSFMMSQGMIIQ